MSCTQERQSPGYKPVHGWEGHEMRDNSPPPRDMTACVPIHIPCSSSLRCMGCRLRNSSLTSCVRILDTWSLTRKAACQPHLCSGHKADYPAHCETRHGENCGHILSASLAHWRVLSL